MVRWILKANRSRGMDGVDDPRVSLGEGQDGSKAALPAWASFMAAAHDTLGLKRQKFERPDGVVDFTICTETKDRPKFMFY